MANQKSEEKRKKIGAQIDENEKKFLTSLTNIQENLDNLIKEI